MLKCIDDIWWHVISPSLYQGANEASYCFVEFDGTYAYLSIGPRYYQVFLTMEQASKFFANYVRKNDISGLIAQMKQREPDVRAQQ